MYTSSTHKNQSREFTSEQIIVNQKEEIAPLPWKHKLQGFLFGVQSLARCMFKNIHWQADAGMRNVLGPLSKLHVCVCASQRHLSRHTNT